MRVETRDEFLVPAPVATDLSVRPPVARRPSVAPEAALQEEIRDSVRLLAGCLGATSLVAVLLHFASVWAG